MITNGLYLLLVEGCGGAYYDGLVNSSIVPTLYYTAGVRPVVVLKSGVKVADGEGTSGDPYQLTLN